MEILGTANPIMQHYVLEAIGFELYALLLIVSNLEGVKLSDVLNWSISCPELDKKLKMASHEQIDLEHFVIQTFTNVKTHYARKHKLILQSEIDELEKNLQSLRFKNTSILQRILGNKKRLIRRGLLAEQRDAERTTSTNEVSNATESSGNATDDNQHE